MFIRSLGTQLNNPETRRYNIYNQGNGQDASNCAQIRQGKNSHGTKAKKIPPEFLGRQVGKNTFGKIKDDKILNHASVLERTVEAQIEFQENNRLTTQQSFVGKFKFFRVFRVRMPLEPANPQPPSPSMKKQTKSLNSMSNEPRRSPKQLFCFFTNRAAIMCSCRHSKSRRAKSHSLYAS